MSEPSAAAAQEPSGDAATGGGGKVKKKPFSKKGRGGSPDGFDSSKLHTAKDATVRHGGQLSPLASVHIYVEGVC